MRRRAIAFVKLGKRAGLTAREVASELDLAPNTLKEWRRARQGREAPTRIGRPLRECTVETRTALISIFSLLPRVGLPTVERLFDDPRRALRRLFKRLQRAWRRKHEQILYRLRWERPGTVWAIDFTDPPTTIDGRYPKVLCVRDLASGNQLLALPAPAANADIVSHALELLFARHGPPLVLKFDNGSHFTAAEIGAVLARHGVTALVSPPYFPRFNGSIEAGIGGLKIRALLEAARHGRPVEWTCDDVEAARLIGNDTARSKQRSPDEVWAARTPITPTEREEFRARVAAEALLWNTESDAPRDPREEAAIRRDSIGRALVAHGLLSVRRRRVRPSVKALKRVGVS